MGFPFIPDQAVGTPTDLIAEQNTNEIDHSLHQINTYQHISPIHPAREDQVLNIQNIQMEEW